MSEVHQPDLPLPLTSPPENTIQTKLDEQSLGAVPLSNLSEASEFSSDSDAAVDGPKSLLIRSNELRKAAMEGDHEAVKRALKEGVDEESMSCATRRAVIMGDIKMVEILARNDVNGRHGAVTAVHSGNYEVARVFFNKGVDVSDALWYVGARDDLRMAKQLLSAGFDCRAVLKGALRADNDDIVSACLEAGVFCGDVFMDAVERNEMEMVRTLGCHAVPYYGEGLKLALEYGKLRAAQWLLDRGANFTLAYK